MDRKLRIGAIILGVVVVVGLILPRLVDVNSFRPKLESELTAALGRQVKVGNLSLSVFSGTVSADDISIADDPAFSQTPFISAKSFKAGVKVMPLITSKTLHVTGITLVEPQITLMRGQDGAWNFSSMGKGKAESSGQDANSGGALSVDKVNVENGSVLVGTANSAEKPHAYTKVNLEVSDFSASSQFPFKLTADLPGGGDMALDGKCGPLTGNAGSAPLEATVKVRKLDLASSGFVEASTGIQGIADLDASLKSDGQSAKSNGTLKVEKLKLAAKGAPSSEAIGVKFAVDQNLKTDAGTISTGDVSIGKALARLTGSFQTQGNTTSLNMQVSGDGMPVDELVGALPALGVVLPPGSKLQGGALTMNLAVSGTSAQPAIAGAVRLSNAKLASFDAGSKLSVIPGLGGKQTGKDTTIQNFSTNVRSAPDGTTANDINLSIPSLGTVTGGGSISPAGALDFRLNVALAGEREAGAIRKAGVGGDGGGVPIIIAGTTSDPKFLPDAKGMAGNAARNALSGAAGGAEKSANPVDAVTGIFRKKR